MKQPKVSIKHAKTLGCSPQDCFGLNLLLMSNNCIQMAIKVPRRKVFTIMISSLSGWEYISGRGPNLPLAPRVKVGVTPGLGFHHTPTLKIQQPRAGGRGADALRRSTLSHPLPEELMNQRFLYLSPLVL